jgi:multidrug efflux pump
MISRFFIDRPIFATVLSVAITLIGLIALAGLPVAQYPHITPPGISITISYPGASAQVVADTVGAPIEQEVNGVPGMLYMSSQSGNDGSYTLTVTFDIGTDVNSALVMVQNRVALAMPQLPTPVQNQGITIRKRTPDMLMIVNLYSPHNTYDDIYLSNFATINLKDELLRVPGISDISYQGERDYSVRIWLDPQKLAAHSITAVDVAGAIQAQNADAPVGRIGQPPSGGGPAFEYTLNTLGRLSEPEQFGDIIVKVGGVPPVISMLGVPAAASASSAGGGSTGSNNSMTSIGSASGSTTTSGTIATSGGTSATGIVSAGGVSTGGGGTTTGGASGGGGGTTSGGGSTTTGGASSSDGSSSDDATSSGDASSVDTSGGGSSGSGSSGSGSPSSPSSAIVRLRDVARIEIGALNYNQSCRFDGYPSVGLGLYQLPGTNALDVADAVRAKMEELKRQFPDDVEYAIAYDTTPYIRESIGDVLVTLVEAVVFVGIVVLFFLQDWRAMILPMIDVPVSLIGTFAVMAVLGFSLNNISLFGLVLTIGIVVDDAIVVLENIERQMAKGYAPREATIRAMDEVTGPIIAVGLVLCAVFVPCAFISGITGQFFNQFAVTIAASTVISAINAITMTPSRAVLIFNADAGAHHKAEALPWWFFAALGGVLAAWKSSVLWPAALSAHLPAAWVPWVWGAAGTLIGGAVGWFAIGIVNAVLGWIFRGFNIVFDLFTHWYGWSIGKLLRVSAVVLLGYAGLLVLTVYTFNKAPTGFIPQQDQGRLIVNVQLPDSASLERTKAAAAKVQKIAMETTGVSHCVCISGLSFLLQATSPNFASMFIVLDSFDKRQKPELRDVVIMDKLRKRWAKEVLDAQVVVFGSPAIPGVGVTGGFKFIVEDRGGLGVRNLEKQTNSLVASLKPKGKSGEKETAVATASTQFRANIPQLFLDIDRPKVASLGVSLDDVNQTLDMFLGSLYVNSYNAYGRHWQVTVQAEDAYRNRVESINLYSVRNNNNQMVTLGTLLQPRDVGGPISVQRYNTYVSAAVSGNVREGYSSGEAIKEIDQTAAKELPRTMGIDWTELMFLQKQAGNSGIYAFVLAVLFVFLALAALYESWSLPLAVVLVVPLCLLCSVAGVLYTGREVNIFVQIGLVVLVALACKNAILIVEFGKQLYEVGSRQQAVGSDAAPLPTAYCLLPTLAQATEDASRLRLRPIMMTSLAFIFGVIPLCVASGAGAEMRRSLGVAVFSGMLGVTMFGIFLTPVFFYVIQGVGETQFFRSERTTAVVSYSLAGGLAAVTAFFMGLLGVVNIFWGPIVAAVAGFALMGMLREIHRRGLVPFKKGGRS